MLLQSPTLISPPASRQKAVPVTVRSSVSAINCAHFLQDVNV